MAEIVGSVEEITNIEKALQDAKATFKAEYGCILNNDTWQFVDLPSTKKVTRIKWIWKLKYKANGTLATLVTQGFL